MDRRMKKATTITVSRGLQYQCPHCKEGRPVTGAVLDLGRVVVEAECIPCRTVIAREFTLTDRSATDVMSLPVIREGCA
jgi:hypothetical protein